MTAPCKIGLRRVQSAVFLFFSLAASSCGIWAGNPKSPRPVEQSGAVSLKLASVAATTRVLGRDGQVDGTFAPDVAILRPSAIVVSGPAGRVEFPGPMVLDLIKGTIEPPVSDLPAA